MRAAGRVVKTAQKEPLLPFQKSESAWAGLTVGITGGSGGSSSTTGSPSGMSPTGSDRSGSRGIGGYESSNITSRT